MNRFLRDNPYYPISEDDIEKFAESAIHAGHPGLEYHVTKDKSLIRTQFAKNMIRLGRQLGLKLNTVGMFTGKPGCITSKHIDGTFGHAFTWRVAYYAKGEAAPLTWFKPVTSEDSIRIKEIEHAGDVRDAPPAGYTEVDATEVVHTELLDMHSAFVRTNEPHQLDMTTTTEPRLTITATFAPEISWEELNERLDELNRNN
jgi:hypothetical protein|tara:strand:- start:28 stop:630 length:603 start_codon:yes stop_codon:yes gene_type:complete